jgi:neutral ceramidase
VGLRAGAASRDITPELRGDFFGYVRPDLRARGVSLRLHAHALVLEDDRDRIGIVTLDLGAPLVAAEVFARVADLGFDRRNLVLAATHTHAGPNAPGRFVVDRVVDAIRAAVGALAPARASWGEAEVTDANRNRSLEAHLANHGLDLYPGTGTDDLDPEGADHPRDVGLRMLRVESPDGHPLAAWAHFSSHPTTFVPANTTFSADFPGVATRRFRAEVGEDAPVTILTNGTEGDLIPRYDEVNQHACADAIGGRVAGAMHLAWDDAGPGSDEIHLAGATRRIAYAGQEIEPGVRVSSRAWFGLPFVGGAQNGPSFLFGWRLEGRRRPAWLAGQVHGRKLRAAPAPWPPQADVTVLRVDDRLLLGVPGEPTVEAGRRMCAAALAAAGDGVTGALVVGLAQDYRGYFTTPEEYDQQHYEGGHTVFGKHTSRLVELTHADLAAELTTEPTVGVTTPPGSAAPPPPAQPASAPTLGRAATRLRVTREPPARVERYGVVTFGWRGARRGHDRPVDTAFLQLVRVNGTSEVVEDDLGTGFVWQQRGRVATAFHEIAADLPTGTYRFRILGVRARTETRTFEVVPSTGARVLGARLDDGDLVVHAQHPPPDPAVVLRSRPRRPAGGQVIVHVGEAEVVARWDATRRGFVVPADALPPGGPPRVVTLANGALTDEHGNRSGPGGTLRVGTLEPLRWPPNLGPGGGRAPGLFGRGPAGRPPPWTSPWP